MDNIMEFVPSIISTKDLSYLSDIFNWNLNASKNAYFISKNIIDEDLKDLAHDIALMHADICNRVICILEGGFNE